MRAEIAPISGFRFLTSDGPAAPFVSLPSVVAPHGGAEVRNRNSETRKSEGRYRILARTLGTIAF
jgi:hypothetical protein